MQELVQSQTDLYDCLKNESPEIKVDAEIAEKAVKPIKRMLEISAQLGL